MNFFVHSIMYGYYAARAAQITMSRYIAMTITGVQIIQMVVGIVINCVAFQLKVSYYVIYSLWFKITAYFHLISQANGRRCDVSFETIYVAMFTYTTLLILFVHFFIRTYYVKSFDKTQLILIANERKKV